MIHPHKKTITPEPSPPSKSVFFKKYFSMFLRDPAINTVIIK